MNNPFSQNGQAWVSPSLNRIRLVEIPGVALPEEIKDRLAYELLSKPALESLIRPLADSLQLDQDSPDLLPAFDRCFASPAITAQAGAQRIAREYGRRLGYLLLTLKRGDIANRLARPDWNSDHWAYWRGINSIWLGGGLVAGRLGPIAAHKAREVLHRAGCPDLQLRLAVDPVTLPLQGAARYAGPIAQAVLVFDFGQTLVKRACAQFENGVLVDLLRFSTVESPCRDVSSGNPSPAQVRHRADMMLQILLRSWDEARQIGQEPDRMMIASLACHLDQGQPYPSQMGCYGCLQLLSNSLPDYFSARLTERLDLPAELRLIQDGTAAASLFAGQPATAVLMLGTAIGIGFPPPAGGLRPLAPQFEAIA